VHPSPKTCRLAAGADSGGTGQRGPATRAVGKGDRMSPALDRLGALTTTGVGSLPFAAPAVAARHAVRAYDLPF